MCRYRTRQCVWFKRKYNLKSLFHVMLNHKQPAASVLGGHSLLNDFTHKKILIHNFYNSSKNVLLPVSGYFYI